MIRDINSLKQFFLRGLKPTQSNFNDLIDSFVHRNDINADIYKIAITKETVSVASDTNVITATNIYSASDTIEVTVNIGDDNSFVLTPPNTFTFPYLLKIGDTIFIKKYGIVPK